MPAATSVIECPECGERVGNDVPRCSHCNHPLGEARAREAEQAQRTIAAKGTGLLAGRRASIGVAGLAAAMLLAFLLVRQAGVF